jgi:hypothetical protein
VIISSTGIVTNGVCPQFITQTWLITDACSNSDTCSQTVTVVNTNLPAINCPSNIVVVSCTNVSVCYSVTATTACCSNVTVVCTPPSCSSFAPGTVTTVNCVATDCCTNTVTCSFTVTVQCCPPLTLFNTGVSTNGSLLGPNSVDPNYTLTTNPNGGGAQAFAVLPTVPGWLANDAISQWIGPATNGGSAPGTYTYQMTFDVPCTNNLVITGQWAVDNLGAIYIDSTANSPVSTITTVTSSSFTTWHPFTISGGLTAGTHTLICVVTNQSGPTGLRLELSGSACCCVPPPSGMTAWWTFDEAAGPVANDIAGTFNNMGTYYGSPTPTPGKVGNALCFNGVTDYVLVPDQAEIDFIGSCISGTNGAESFTIDTWIRATANGPGQQTVLDKRVNVNTAPQGYELFLYYGKLGFQIADGAGYGNYIAPAPDLRDGQWHFIAVTVARCGTNGNAGTLYVDNNAVLTFLDPRTGDLNNTASLAIGLPDPYYGFSYYSGCLDELEIFKRVLAPQELQSIFNAGSAGKCKTNCLGALTLTCATNKIVQCPAKWSFDPPSVSDPCCGTNYTLTFTTVTNGTSCSNVFTRTWQVIDCLQRTAACSQTVTVVNTNLPVLTCASNKTVQCGTAWSFDAPTAFDACCTNLAITVIGTVTNAVTTNGVIVPCAINYTRTWQVTDCCTNTATCSQTVTVVNTNPPVINCPSNIVVVSCTNVPVCYSVTATSACCSNVTVVCTPPSCSSFAPGTVTTVNCVAKDCCGNTATCSFTVTVQGCVTPPTNMVLWLPFDESIGPVSANIAPVLGANNGLQVGGPGVVVGAHVDNSLSFNGANQHVTVLNYPAIEIGTNDCTIDAWVNRATNGPNSLPSVIVDKRDANYVGYSLSVSYGRLILSWGGNYADTGSLKVPPDGLWHFVAVSVSQSARNVLFYIDGVANSTVALIPTDVSNTSAFWVGASPLGGNRPWLGDLDEVEVYDRALSTNELYGIYSAGPCGKCKPPCATIAVICPTDKTVPCGSAWTFDLPLASSCCGSNVITSTGVVTNVIITATGTVTNSGPCPWVITQTWLLTDACGNSNTCSQTVTVVNTNPPGLHCASNKTVPCGTAWSFDAPTATDACCTNLTITVIGTVTNGVMTNGVTSPCGINYTRTWLVTDCCTNTATCSQTVTVVNDLPPIVNVLCVTNVYFAGGGNGFTTPVPSSPSAGLLARFAGDTFKQFDQCLINSVFIDTFSHLPPCITSAYLTMGLKPCGDIPDNDAINLAFTGAGGILEIGSDSWSSYIGTVDNGTSTSGLVPGTWSSYTSGQVITLDLGNLPPGTGGPTSLLSDLNRYGFLDFELEDDTGVDYLQLTVVTCCCSTNKTVQCGSGWTFDVPTAVDACSGAPVPATILSTVTNGLCPQVITRTWLFTDVCGNTNTCSQTVTVVNTNPPVMHCASNKTVQCGTLWSFDAPTATDACCTNVAITVLGTLVASQPNACTNVYTRTWEATDCCSNRATCSQTVTVVDTTAPVILNCPYPTVTVPLRPCNQILIPAIKLIATDNCTPTSLLHWSQSPPANTIVSGPSASVTVTVTDLCGNSSHCVVQVVGLGTQTGGLVVTCPTSMTVTNCLVPLVPVTATDPCCTNPPVITQQPPANTPCPGSFVTVTVTDCGSTVTRSVALNFSGPQSFLGNLYNTGNHNPAGQPASLLVDDAVDPHYALPSNEVPGGTGVGCPGNPLRSDYFGTAVAVSDRCWSSGNYCAWDNNYVSYTCYEYVPWSLPPDPAHTTTAVSKWIAPDYTNNGCCPSGPYTYTLAFTLPSTINLATATIQGRFAADNRAGIYLNGAPVPAGDGGVTLGGIYGFAQWTSFTIPPGSFNTGPNNNLVFIVTNTDACSWTGLRVEFTNAIANCCTCSPPVIHNLITGPMVSSSSTYGLVSTLTSLPVGSTATFTVNAGGTPPLAYQWYLNGVPLVNNGHYSGVTTPTLQVHPLGYADGGLYSVVIANPCGVVTGYVSLNVTPPLGWPIGLWNVAVLSSPLAATIGPDLVLVGSSVATNFAITAGTTEDFGLPEEGGQVVNVMDINPNAAASIQIPLLSASGSSTDPSYTVMMDLYEPDTSLGTPSTLCQSIPCCVSNLSSSGQDGVTLTLDAQNNLHVTGSAAGVPFDTGPTTNLAVDAWNRVALVVDDPQDGVAVNLGLYLNGQQVGSLTVPTPVGLPINWSNGPPTLLSRQTNDVSPNAEFYVSSIQFAAAALAPQQIAGMGSPDNGPAPANQTSVGTQPVLSATVSGGTISLSWTGSPYVLQETTDLSSGVWVDSTLPFTEEAVAAGGSGNTQTTAIAAPAAGGAPQKFYRLIFRP